MIGIFDSQKFCYETWRDLLKQLTPDCQLYNANGDDIPQSPAFLLLWKPKREDWSACTTVKVAIALGAGLDACDQIKLPPNVRLQRLEDSGMKRAMCEYAHYGVLRYQRHFFDYQRFQQESVWQPLAYQGRTRFTIGILGLGALGLDVAQYLEKTGYHVIGCSKNKKSIRNIKHYKSETELDSFLAQSNVLVNMLPLNGETYHSLGFAEFMKMPKNATLLSLSRGAIIQEAGLLQAINCGHMAWALLDVFEEEPLNEEHPFWRHPKIEVTPHISAPTQEQEAVKEVFSLLNQLL